MRRITTTRGAQMQHKIGNVFELYALALAIGEAFSNHYRTAARQSRLMGEREVAALFETLEGLECGRALQIDRWAHGSRLPLVDAVPFLSLCEPRWPGTGDARRLLQTTVSAEETLRACFNWIAAAAEDESVRMTATMLAATRESHIWHLRGQLARRANSPVPPGLFVNAPIFATA
jgi:hypothetical protein